MINPNEYTQKRLLKIIDNSESYDELTNKQISYSTIAMMIVDFLKEGFIKNSPNGYILTEKGYSFIKPHGKKEFEEIEPLNEFRTEKKMSIDEVYYSKYIKEVIKELKN